jgi:phage shock protein PspC (stress-responsive transcriptional regulator)
MTTHTKPLSTPKDNLLGICNALGEDFSFNPLWLRLALGAAFVIQPLGVVVGYLALGLVVLASRLAFPNARTSPQAPEDMPEVVAAPRAAAVHDDEQVFAKAA